MILLDTHVVVWLAFDPSGLSRNATSAIDNARKNGDGLSVESASHDLVREVACIRQRHHFGFERELGTEFFGSRIILRAEQTAKSYPGLLHKLSELLCSQPCHSDPAVAGEESRSGSFSQ